MMYMFMSCTEDRQTLEFWQTGITPDQASRMAYRLAEKLDRRVLVLAVDPAGNETTFGFVSYKPGIGYMFAATRAAGASGD